ncbi:MAG: TMEM165/GDT1 family protein [Microcoleaceae cyanobacterium]
MTSSEQPVEAFTSAEQSIEPTLNLTLNQALDQRIESSPSADSPAMSQAEPGTRPGMWAVFGSTFVTIFLAEIGDKTQVTTLLMTAESHNPWVVFAGAGTALVLTSLLGVLVGQWLANRIAPQTLERSAGVSLIVIAALLILEVLQS